MPAKKKGKKKGKKGKKTKKLTPEQLEEENQLLKLRVETLERYLLLRTEQAQRSRMDSELMRSRLCDLETDFEKEEAERLALATDMIRQYKSTQSELVKKINNSERRAHELEDKLAISNIALDQTREKKDAIIAQKHKEIEEQKQKMEDMVQEFGEMMRDTLAKMGKTIVDSSQVDDDISLELRRNENLTDIVGENALQHEIRKIRLAVDRPEA